MADQLPERQDAPSIDATVFLDIEDALTAKTIKAMRSRLNPLLKTLAYLIEQKKFDVASAAVAHFNFDGLVVAGLDTFSRHAFQFGTSRIVPPESEHTQPPDPDDLQRANAVFYKILRSTGTATLQAMLSGMIQGERQKGEVPQPEIAPKQEALLTESKQKWETPRFKEVGELDGTSCLPMSQMGLSHKGSWHPSGEVATALEIPKSDPADNFPEKDRPLFPGLSDLLSFSSPEPMRVSDPDQDFPIGKFQFQKALFGNPNPPSEVSVGHFSDEVPAYTWPTSDPLGDLTREDILALGSEPSASFEPPSTAKSEVGRLGEFLRPTFPPMWLGQDCNCTVHKLAADKIREFQSFDKTKANDAADVLARMTSSLHTSRLSALGYVVEAEYLQITTYAISAQLDTRICPVCTAMHGRIFKVEDARQLLNQVLTTDNPAELKSLQPWPSQKLQNVKAIAGSTAADLVAKGWHIPPYHPLCRCLTTQTTEVHDIDATPSMQAAISEKPALAVYKPNRWDFVALGLNAAPEILNAWAVHFLLSPRKIIGKLVGLDPSLVTQDALATANVKAQIADGVLQVKGPMQYGGVTSNLNIKIDINNGQATLQSKPPVETFDDYVKSVLRTLRDAGVPSVSVTVTGGAWGKFGFIPSFDSWTAMAPKMLKKLRAIAGSLSTDVFEQYEALLQSTNPRAFASLWTLPGNQGGLPMAEYLVQGIKYQATAFLSDTLVTSKL